MNLLAFYTASEPSSVALVRPAGGTARRLAARASVEGLVPAARALLDQAGLRPKGLDGVAVARGPGSFTGLRVGAAAALGLARAAGLSLFAPGTLEAWAAAGLTGAGAGARCEVVLDARREELYVGAFEAGPVSVRRLRGPEAVPAPRALAILERGVRVVGDGRASLLLAGLDPRTEGFAVPEDPLALWVARVVAADPAAYAVALEDLVLDYVREPQAVAARSARRAAAAREA